MRSKVHIRKMINYYKQEYSVSRDKDLLLYIAILKGMYLALGGKKGIPLNNNLDFIVKYSKTLFSYEYKLKTSKKDSRIKAHIWLEEELRKNGKYIGSVVDRFYASMFNNIELAKLMAELICYEYREDIFINSNKIYNITLELMDKTEINKEDTLYG